jgi:choline dehydrogenase
MTSTLPLPDPISNRSERVWDYVIVGAGSAGCVLANRLSAKPGNRVLLLEAGGSDENVLFAMPAAVALVLPPERRHPANWAFWTEPQSQLDGRSLYWPRGRVLGGSSSINGMIYIRGHPSDFDRWAQMGCRGWSWDAVRPFFLEAERSDRPPSDWHGSHGPLATSCRSFPHPLVDVFLDACAEVGIAPTADFNGEHMEGAAVYDTTTLDGRRCSASAAYLRPVLGRPNLTVWTGAFVERVTFRGRQASGVLVRRKDQTHHVSARQIVLSGGAVNSPQLLMLSGIGPAEHLRECGIAVVHDAPGVGANLQDHLDVILQWRSKRPVTLNAHSAPHRQALIALEWLLARKGLGRSVPTPAGAFFSTRPGLEAPDAQIHFTPGLVAPHGRGGVPAQHGFQMHVCQLRPESRGRVRLRSPKAQDAPSIDPAYLTATEDVQTLLAAIAVTRRIAQAPAFAPFVGEELWPGDRAVGAQDVLTASRAWAESIYHPVGTCRMGDNPQSVVDPSLRVRGVQGLRVVDASIMPTLISGNTNAATIMIAEKASHDILTSGS